MGSWFVDIVHPAGEGRTGAVLAMAQKPEVVTVPPYPQSGSRQTRAEVLFI